MESVQREWTNFGIAIAFQPFSWDIGGDRYFDHCCIYIGPLTFTVGWA